jgi:hypothetical protein
MATMVTMTTMGQQQWRLGDNNIECGGNGGNRGHLKWEWYGCGTAVDRAVGQ